MAVYSKQFIFYQPRTQGYPPVAAPGKGRARGGGANAPQIIFYPPPFCPPLKKIN
jgi:hypothetical protein